MGGGVSGCSLCYSRPSLTTPGGQREMQVDTPDTIRNLAVTGHNDTGKTTLVSSLLFTGGATDKLGRVEEGNTVTDFDQEEVDRGISIGLAPAFVPWKDTK